VSANLVRLIYASRRPAAPPRDLDQEVRDILIASINNNRMVSISGLLVTHDDWFLQALEGPEDAVARTYERIERDPRHAEAVRRTVGAIEARRFPRWTMSAQDMSCADEVIIRRLVSGGGFDPFASDPAAALALLGSVADLHGQLLNDRYAELQGEVLLPG